MPATPVTEVADEATSVSPLWFAQEYALRISGRAFIVPISIAVEEITSMIEESKLILDQLKGLEHLFVHQNSSYQSINHLVTWAQRLENEYNHLHDLTYNFIHSKLRHSSRSRRSPFDFVGSLSNSLFGVATQHQIDEIHDRIDQIGSLSQNELDQLNLHTQIINETVRNVQMMQMDITKLRSTVQFIIDASMHSQHVTWISMITVCQDLIWALNTIHSNFLTMVLGINEFMEKGYPSSHLISDRAFSSLLEIAGKRGNGLILPAQPNNLILYRSISSIITKYRQDGSIIFYLSLPLSDAVYGPFELYRIGSLPIPIHNTSQFIAYKSPNRYIAVSRDHRRFMLLKDLDDCTTFSSLAICNPSQPIYSTGAPNCEFAVFQGDEEDTCVKQITSTFTPEFIKADNGYYYATPTPLKLIVKCPNKKFSKTIAGTGFLDLPADCEVHSDMLSLPAHTTIKGSQLTIHTSTSNSSYRLPKPVQRISNTFKKYGRVLTDEIARDSPMDADLAVAKLQMLQREQTAKFKQWTSPSILLNYGMITSISLAAIGVLIWHRFNTCRRRNKARQRSTDLSKLRHEEVVEALIQLRQIEQGI